MKVCYIVGHSYQRVQVISEYIFVLSKCFICSNFKTLKKSFLSKLESHFLDIHTYAHWPDIVILKQIVTPVYFKYCCNISAYLLQHVHLIQCYFTSYGAWSILYLSMLLKSRDWIKYSIPLLKL